MNILDFPPEIFHKILSYSILARSYDANLGVVRGLRLKLVCRAFYFAIDEALFESKLLDSFQLFYDSPGASYLAPWLRHNWRVCRFYGADRFWQRYVVYRATREKDPNIGRFVDIKSIAQIICKETGAEYDTILDTIAWLALEGATNFMFYREKEPGREGWWLYSHPDLGLDDDSGSASNPQRLAENLLSVAAHLNLLPLAKRLLSTEGTDPTRHNNLFDPPIMLAAYAGHHEMLELLQQSVPAAPAQPLDESIWITTAQRLGIHGAAQRGDIKLLLDAAHRPLFEENQRAIARRRPRFPSRDVYYHTNVNIFKPSGEGGDTARAAQWTKDFKTFNRTMSSIPPNYAEPPSYHETLQWACWLGHLDLVKYCIDNRDEWPEHPEDEEPDEDQEIDCQPRPDPLVIAARAGHEDMVDLFLSRGYKADHQTLAAAAASGSLGMVRKLLDHGAADHVSHHISSCKFLSCTVADRQRYRSEQQYQAFRIAVRMENRPMMELLRKRTTLSQTDLDEALRDAVSFGLESMALLLWEWGARLNPINFKLDWEDRVMGVDLWEKEVNRVLALVEALEWNR